MKGYFKCNSKHLDTTLKARRCSNTAKDDCRVLGKTEKGNPYLFLTHLLSYHFRKELYPTPTVSVQNCMCCTVLVWRLFEVNTSSHCDSPIWTRVYLLSLWTQMRTRTWIVSLSSEHMLHLLTRDNLRARNLLHLSSRRDPLKSTHAAYWFSEESDPQKGTNSSGFLLHSHSQTKARSALHLL